MTGESAGRVLRRERNYLRGADDVTLPGRQHGPFCSNREGWTGPAWSKTPRMHGNALHGNREIPRLPLGDGPGGRALNPQGGRGVGRWGRDAE